MTELKSHLYQLNIIAWNDQQMEEGREPNVHRENPQQPASENATY